MNNKSFLYLLFVALIISIVVNVVLVISVLKQRASNDVTVLNEQTIKQTNEDGKENNDEVIEEVELTLAENLQKSIDKMKKLDNYTVYYSDGYECINYLKIDFDNEGFEASVYNSGDTTCDFPSEMFIKKVGDNVSYSYDGINWEDGYPQNINGYEFKVPEKVSLSEILPQGFISEEKNTYLSNTTNTELAYQDEIIDLSDTSRNDFFSEKYTPEKFHNYSTFAIEIGSKAKYQLNRVIGDGCVENTESNDVYVDCAYPTWSFDENYNLVFYESGKFEYSSFGIYDL